MAKRVKLREICHGRSGDKGSDLNVGLAVYNPKHYEWLKRHLTAEVVAEYVGEYLGGWGNGPVTRYELPKLAAVNFFIPGGLLGGATRSVLLDGHGKSFSQILLDMEVDAPQEEEAT